jgi:hypothetical protein
MSITTVKNTSVYVSNETSPVGSSQENLVLTDYTTGLTWVQVGNLEGIGEFGDEATVTKFETITSGRVVKLKGIADAGKLDLSCAFDTTDVGQIQLRLSATEALQRSYKVVVNDKLTVGGTGTTFYFRGLCMSARTKLGKASDVILQDFSIEVNTAVLEVAAS